MAAEFVSGIFVRGYAAPTTSLSLPFCRSGVRRKNSVLWRVEAMGALYGANFSSVCTIDKFGEINYNVVGLYCPCLRGGGWGKGCRGVRRTNMVKHEYLHSTPHFVRLDLRKVINHPGYTVVTHFETDVQLWEEGQWVHVSGEAVGTNVDGRYVLVTGKVVGMVELECSRCLTVFEQKIEAPFEAQCDIRTFHMLAEGLPVEEGEEITAIFDANSADLWELSRQALIVNLPMRPLCSEDCKGLCPICGANLNETTCDCQPPADPRWAALELLFQQLKS